MKKTRRKCLLQQSLNLNLIRQEVIQKRQTNKHPQKRPSLTQKLNRKKNRKNLNMQVVSLNQSNLEIQEFTQTAPLIQDARPLRVVALTTNSIP